MTDREKIEFIVCNDERTISFLSSVTGWSPEEIHERYHNVHKNGEYLKIRDRKEELQKIDKDLFLLRLHKIAPVDGTHSESYWSKVAKVHSAWFTKVYTGREECVSYPFVARIAVALGVEPKWLAGAG